MARRSRTGICPRRWPRSAPSFAPRRWRPPVREDPRAAPEDGIGAVEEACAEALEAGIASGDVVIAILARKRQPPPAPSITTPDALKLKAEPIADCARYDNLRKGKEAA